MTALPIPGPQWTDVCGYGELVPERGGCALVAGQQVALFRLWDGSVHAVGNYDPFGGAFVISRGIVGTRGDAPIVVSPLLKHAFDLRTGTCLDDGSVCLPVYPARVWRGRVQVAPP